jgi:hypothetical protein
MAAVSKSRNVCGYIKAHARHEKLLARMVAAEEKLRPLKTLREAAWLDMRQRRLRLTGGQAAEADRILKGQVGV